MSDAVDPERHASQDIGKKGKGERQAVRYPEVTPVVVIKVDDTFCRDIGLDKGSM